MSTSAHMSDSTEDTKCCSTCVGCRKATNLIKYYTQCRKEEKYHWLRYDMKHGWNGCLLWSFRDGPKCKVFSTTSNETRYATISNGDPYVLAYVDLYAPENVSSGKFGSYTS